MELNFNEWLELDQCIMEMVRAASPAESAKWLKQYLEKSAQSVTDWKRINARYWLRPEKFKELLNKFLLNPKNVINPNPEEVKQNLNYLMNVDLQKDVGFGSRRNMAYARKLQQEPEIALHPAYGTDVAYRRKVGGDGVHRIGQTHSADAKARIGLTRRLATMQPIIDANPMLFAKIKRKYNKLPDNEAMLAAVKELTDYVKLGLINKV